MTARNRNKNTAKNITKDALLEAKWEAIRENYNDFLLWLKGFGREHEGSVLFSDLRAELNKRFYPGPGDTFGGKRTSGWERGKQRKVTK